MNEKIKWNDLRVTIAGTQNIPILITLCEIEKINEEWGFIHLRWDCLLSQDVVATSQPYKHVERLGFANYLGPICILRFLEPKDKREKFEVRLHYEKEEKCPIYGYFVEQHGYGVKIYFAQCEWQIKTCLINKKYTLSNDLFTP